MSIFTRNKIITQISTRIVQTHDNTQCNIDTMIIRKGFANQKKKVQLTTNLVLISPNWLTPEKIPSAVLWGQKVLNLNIQAKVAGLYSTKSRRTLTILFSTSLLYSNKGEEPRCVRYLVAKGPGYPLH